MFKNQFPQFQPKFGNQSHIRILEKMREYYKMRTEIELWMKDKKRVVEKKKKSLQLKNQIREMIKFEEQKTGN